MRTKFTFVLLLVMLFSLYSEFSLFQASSVSSPVSAFALGTTMPRNVELIKNDGTSITINGNLTISGNDVTRFAGLSPSLRAKVYLNGSIEIRDNGTLVLQYVTLYFIGAKRGSEPFNRYIRLYTPINIGLGQSNSFVCSVSGGLPPYSYQWFLNGTAVSGATDQTWTFTPTSIGTYYVSVKVTDAFSEVAQSFIAQVVVNPQQPIGVTVSPSFSVLDLGQSVSFSSSVSGGVPPYSYQWYLDGEPVSGATNPAWDFTPASPGKYQVYLKVSDSQGVKSTSNFVPVVVLVKTPLSATVNPASATIGLGQSNSFVCSVSGGLPPYSYQWFLNGTAVSGATDQNWTFTPTSIGTYEIYAQVTDALSEIVQSSVAWLTVNPAPVLTVKVGPGFAVMNAGQSKTFTADVSGGKTPYRYQWYLNDVSVRGATAKSWAFTPTSGGIYRVYCVVTDSSTPVSVKGTSNVVPVIVNPSPMAVIGPTYGIGYPRLVVSNATIIASTVMTVTSGGRNYDVSAPCAIYAYGTSEISGKEFAFYRDKVVATNAKIGNTTVVKCYDRSFVDLSYCNGVESLQAFDRSTVSISMGRGPGKSTNDRGMLLSVKDFSRTEAYGVTFFEATVSNNANMTFRFCKEESQGFMKAKDFARVNILDGCDFRGSLSVAAVNASENSYVFLNNSKVVCSLKNYFGVVVSGDATFVASNATFSGRIVAYDRSRVFLSEMNSPTAMRQVWIESHGFSNVSLLNCWLTFSVRTSEITTYDYSRLYFVNSTLQYSWAQAFNSSYVYFSKAKVQYTQMSIGHLANVTLTAGSSFDTSLELREGSSLLVDSSYVFVIHGLGVSKMSLVNSNVSMLYIRDDSKVRSVNSKIKELSFSASNVSGSWVGLTNFFKNSSFTLQGRAPDVILYDTFVYGLDVVFMGNSNVTIADSALRNVAVFDNGVVYLRNVSALWDSVIAADSARVYVWSALSVRVVDYFGSPLSGADISVYGGVSTVSAKIVASGKADDDGRAVFLLFSEMFNASGRFSFGGIVVRGKVGKVSKEQLVDFSANVESVTLSLPLPWWSGYLFPAVVLVLIIVIVVVLSFVYKKLRSRRER